MSLSKRDITAYIKDEAKGMGFLECGITCAEYLQEDAPRLDNWLSKGYQADMGYMERNLEKRKNPALLVPGAKSVILVLYNYFPSGFQDIDAPRIAKYAYGKDYHLILRPKLYALLEKIREHFPDAKGRAFTDSAPVLESALARLAGLGWIGKNSLLLNKRHGSFFFIGELILNIELEYDNPVAEACGLCNLCIEACPTKAILPDKIIDSNRCISYYTIEYKGVSIPENFKGTFKNNIFGCDICQDVCPWNRKKSTPHQNPESTAISQLLSMNQTDWENINEPDFGALTNENALQRTGFKGIKRNLAFLKNKD